MEKPNFGYEHMGKHQSAVQMRLASGPHATKSQELQTETRQTKDYIILNYSKHSLRTGSSSTRAESQARTSEL